MQGRVKLAARVLTLLTPVILTAACGPIDAPDEPTPIEPPDIETELVYDSERVQVFIEPGMPFCRGDGARMDEHINRLSAHIGVEPPSQVQVYVVEDDHGNLIADWCFGSHDSLGGCAQHGMIMAKMWALHHELNHAVFHTLNPDVQWASPFWLEAYASAYEPRDTRQYFSGLEEQSNTAAYHAAHHLIRWLEDTRGTDAVIEFYASFERDWERKEVDAAFAEVFGLSYEQALEDYQLEAAVLYPGFGWCDEIEVIDVLLGETPVTLRADCEQPTTYAFASPPIEAMYVRRILRLEQGSEILIEASTPVGILNLHPCFDEPAYTEEDPRLSSAWYSDIAGGVPPMGTLLGPYDLETGNTVVEFVFPLGEAVEVDLVITAEPGSKSN